MPGNSAKTRGYELDNSKQAGQDKYQFQSRAALESRGKTQMRPSRLDDCWHPGARVHIIRGTTHFLASQDVQHASTS